MQLLVHLLQRRFGGAAIDIIDRNKQRAQRFKVSQHAVGDHFDVAAHAGHRVEQGQAVKCTGGVVGDDDQRTMFGDLFEIVRRDSAADIKMFEHLFDRIQSFQVMMTRGKLLKLFLMQELFQHLFLPERWLCLRPQVIDDIVETKHSGTSSVLPRQ